MAKERREEKERRERGYDDLFVGGEGKSNEEGWDEDDFSRCILFFGSWGRRGGERRDRRDRVRLRESLLGDCHSVEDFVVQ